MEAFTDCSPRNCDCKFVSLNFFSFSIYLSSQQATEKQKQTQPENSPLELFLKPAKKLNFASAMINMIILDFMPLSFVEKSGFQELLSVLSPAYVIPSRDSLLSLLDNEYQKAKRELRLFVRTNAVNYLTYTSDLWKPLKANQYYLSVRLHFIDHEWKVNRPLIATSHVTGPTLFSFSSLTMKLFKPCLGDYKKSTIGEKASNLIAPFLGKHMIVHSGVTDSGEVTSISYSQRVFLFTLLFLLSFSPFFFFIIFFSLICCIEIKRW